MGDMDPNGLPGSPQPGPHLSRPSRRGLSASASRRACRRSRCRASSASRRATCALIPRSLKTSWCRSRAARTAACCTLCGDGRGQRPGRARPGPGGPFLHLLPGHSSCLATVLAFFSLFLKFVFGCIFVAARGLSLVAASRGYSSLQCAGFSLWWLPLLRSTGSRPTGFSSCGSRALECRLSSCGTRA